MSQLAGESTKQYVERIEGQLADALATIDRHELDDELAANAHDSVVSNLQYANADTERERDFLREQLAELALQISSDSAPRTRRQMARLLDGLLRGEDWRHGTWRR